MSDHRQQNAVKTGEIADSAGFPRTKVLIITEYHSPRLLSSHNGTPAGLRFKAYLSIASHVGPPAGLEIATDKNPQIQRGKNTYHCGIS